MPHALRWLWPRGLGLLLCVTLVVALWPAHRAPKRVAIRVDCTDAPACTLAESLALDVWSEERGPKLPLDVVVAEPALDRLEAAGVQWQVLVPDIDAVAREERARLRHPSAARGTDWFAEYRDYRSITEHLRELALSAPDRVTM